MKAKPHDKNSKSRSIKLEARPVRAIIDQNDRIIGCVFEWNNGEHSVMKFERKAERTLFASLLLELEAQSTVARR